MQYSNSVQMISDGFFRWRNNWLHQRFTERILFERNGNLGFATDDNWLVVISGPNVHCWSCQTSFHLSSMCIPNVELQYATIIESTPKNLKIAITGYMNHKTVLCIVDPISKTVLKMIEPCRPALAPFCFKYQFKLIYVASGN